MSKLKGQEYLTELIEAIDSTLKRIQLKDWREFTPKGFHLNIIKTIEEIEEIEVVLEKLNTWMKAKGYSDSIGLEKQLNSIKTLKKYLEKQSELEEKKSKKLTEHYLKEVLTENQKELYSSIENKVLNELLKLRYLSERINLHLKRRNTPLKFESTGKQILLLLEQKEKELQELQEKYNELKLNKKTFMIQEKNTGDIEKELNELIITTEKKTSELKEKTIENLKKINEIKTSLEIIEKQTNTLDELNSRMHLKAMELITELKKERDYSRKITIETEHETMKLRNTYSNQLLELEKEKFNAKKEAEKEFEKENKKLLKELKEKKELIKRLEKIIDKQNK